MVKPSHFDRSRFLHCKDHLNIIFCMRLLHTSVYIQYCVYITKAIFWLTLIMLTMVMRCDDR